MLLKTHLAISIFFILLLLPLIEYKIVFVIIAIIATYIPDIDSRFSKIGKSKIFRILQWLTKHRGIIHSFTFLLILSFLLFSISHVLVLGFFLGYGLHLLADSFTVSGIRPFWPFKISFSGIIRTGKLMEKIILVLFVIGDLALLYYRFLGFF